MRQLFWIVFLFALSMPVSMNAQTCGTTNIAIGKPVDVLNQWSFDPASNAVDGNSTTFWANDENRLDTNYLNVDLQQSYTICKVIVRWGGDYPGKDYQIQTSTDGTNWTTQASRTNNSAFIDSFSVVGTGRYVRIYMTSKPFTWVDYKIKEFEIYNYLSNFHPNVSLTSPANNSTTVSGTNIKLTANASDPDGSITKVEFYQDTVKLGESTIAPYNYTLFNVQPGTFVFRAKAFDNTSADSLSTAVNVTVNPSNRWSLTGNSGTNPDSNFVGTLDNKKLVFKTNNVKRVTIQTNGFVGIGVDSSSNADVKLGVAGTIAARKLQITQASWADYVFNKNYPLMGLPELQRYISKYGHLPGLPTSKEVEKNGVEVSATLETLLRKIEELTLYTLEQNKKITALNNKVNRQQRQLYKLSQRKK